MNSEILLEVKKREIFTWLWVELKHKESIGAGSRGITQN